VKVCGGVLIEWSSEEEMGSEAKRRGGRWVGPAVSVLGGGGIL